MGQNPESKLNETFKIMYGIYYIDRGEFFFKLDDGDRRGHNKKLWKRRFRLHVRKIFLVTELWFVDHWNSQSEESINANSINTLKKDNNWNQKLIWCVRESRLYVPIKVKVTPFLSSASSQTPLTRSDMDHTVLPANSTVSISHAAPPHIYA